MMPPTYLVRLFAIGLCVLTLAPRTAASQAIQADRRVEFRLRAPSASNVQVVIEGRPGVAMQRNTEGAWLATVGPLEPAMYNYTFTVDGVNVVDPLNYSKQFQVPGASAMPWDADAVPHGVLHQHFYRSSISAFNRDFYVYTPPGYDQAKARYPVLYLLHGGPGASSDWTATGRVHLMLDYLIAAGRAKPMLIVMPIGYGMPDYSRLPRTPATRRDSFTKFGDALISEMMPMVEKAYRVEPGARARAIAGLSMGGAEALFVGLSRPEQFGWIGAFSSGQIIDTDFDAAFPTAGPHINKQLRLLWLGCGIDDDTIVNNRKFRAWLTGKSITHTGVEAPGFHEWPVWRRHFLEFAPLLFRD